MSASGELGDAVRMRRVLLWTVFLLGATGGARALYAADAPDPARGELLYQNHCRFCHAPAIHERPRRSPLTHDELGAIVLHWSRQQNLTWAEQDVRDVVDHLERTRYRLR